MKTRLPGTARGRHGWVALITALCACAFFIYLWSPLYGDDLAYKMIFSGPNAVRGSWLEYPRFAAGHWLGCNGRLTDKLMPLVMNFPSGLRALLCAAGLWGMYYFAVKASGALRGYTPWLLIAGLAFVLPWWDSAFVFAVQLNYVWSSALLLWAYCLIFRGGLSRSRLSEAGALAVCFCGGMSHEGGAVPLLFGMAVYFAVRRERPAGRTGLRFAAFAAGAAATLLSPALWHRVENPLFEPNDTPLWLILKSEPAVLALWGIVLAALLTRGARRLLREASASPEGVLAYATLAGAPIIVASGIVGRTGWFVTVYALAFLAWMAGRLSGGRALPWLEWGVAVLLICQAAGEAWLQRGLYMEYRDYEARFLSSADGVVEGRRYTMDDELPWWTLNRLRGVPEADDLYILEMMGAYFRTDGATPVLIGPETRFTDTLPPGAAPIECNAMRSWTAKRDGVEYVYTPVRGRYAEDRRILDPGDR